MPLEAIVAFAEVLRGFRLIPSTVLVNGADHKFSDGKKWKQKPESFRQPYYAEAKKIVAES